jgi:hypothetical protein
METLGDRVGWDSRIEGLKFEDAIIYGVNGSKPTVVSYLALIPKPNLIVFTS